MKQASELKRTVQRHNLKSPIALRAGFLHEFVSPCISVVRADARATAIIISVAQGSRQLVGPACGVFDAASSEAPC
jgi:hypothetical protein